MLWVSGGWVVEEKGVGANRWVGGWVGETYQKEPLRVPAVVLSSSMAW